MLTDPDSFRHLADAAQKAFNIDPAVVPEDEGTTVPSLNDKFLSLDDGLEAFIHEILQSQKDASTPQFLDFRSEHVEQLLDQAADLLDRGLRTRAEADALRARAFLLGLEFKEFIKTDAIHTEEVRSGLYRQTISAINADVAEQEQLLAAHQAAKEEIDKFINNGANPDGRALFSLENIETNANQAHFAARVSCMPATGIEFARDYIIGGGDDNLRKSSNIDLNTNPRDQLMSYTDSAAKFNQGPKSKLSHLGDIASGESKLAAQIERLQFVVQLALETGQVEGITAKLHGLKQKQAFEESNDGVPDPGQNLDGKFFRFRRAEVAREIMANKMLGALKDGPLAFPDQALRFGQHYRRDCIDALMRVAAAAIGIDKIYGYSTPLPDSVLMMLPDSVRKMLPGAKGVASQSKGSELSFLDDCLDWVRGAIAYLIRFSQLEQNYILPISVRSQLVLKNTKTNTESSDAAWQSLLKGDTRFFFLAERSIQDEMLDQRHVRLRGISAFTVGAASGELWTVTVRPPQQSFCHHLDILKKGAQDSGMRDLDQSRVPSCRLARVEARDAQRVPDVVGITALHNVSPFTLVDKNWTIKLKPMSANAAAELQDIHLDLHIAMRVNKPS